MTDDAVETLDMHLVRIEHDEPENYVQAAFAQARRQHGMPQTSFDNLDVSHPISIGPGPSETGPRLGGRAPSGVDVPDGFTYLLSLPHPDDETAEVSLFVSADQDALIASAGTLATPSEARVVVHPAGKRRTAGGPGDSALSEHPLLISSAREDLTTEDGEVTPFSGHKIGGRPYIVEKGHPLDTKVQDLVDGGYRQFLQLDFPGNEGDADVSGPWPFGTGMIHVMVRLDPQGADWVCFWEL